MSSAVSNDVARADGLIAVAVLSALAVSLPGRVDRVTEHEVRCFVCA